MRIIHCQPAEERTSPMDWLQRRAMGRPPQMKKTVGVRARIELTGEERAMPFDQLSRLILAELRQHPAAAGIRLIRVDPRGFGRRPLPQTMTVEAKV